jgi:DUF4097 and DUF4098 domain-containing protein YvlB
MMAVATTDQTVDVAKGTKLSVNNFAGDVVIKTWGRDAVRVEVNHSDRETVEIKQVDQTVSVRSRSTRGGPSRSLDYNITVPTWMGITVSGTYADVNAEGVGGDVSVETTHGDITVRGGSGFISLKTVQGMVTLEKARGRVEVRAVNEGIRLADISADLSAESTNGSIMLDRIDSANVDLYTVNGSISYDGAIKDKGLYRLTTHNGLIAMPIAERANITLSARTYNGGIRSSFTLPAPAADQNSERRNKRVNLTLGNGSAHVELESFSGTIALRRPGEPRPETEGRRRERHDQDADKDKDKDKDKPKIKGDVGADVADVNDMNVEAIVAGALAAAEASIPAAIAEASAAIPAAIADALDSIDFPTPAPHIAPRPDPQPRPAPLPQRRR